MPLPPELLAPAPRDPVHAQRFLEKTRKTARQLLVGGALLVPALTVVFALVWGPGGQALGVALGVGGLVGFMGLGLQVNIRRSLQLYTEGTAVLGRIKKVSAPASEATTALVVEVEFTGAQGPCLGQVVLLPEPGQAQAREGLEVPVLFSAARPKAFAVYVSGLGMYAGTLK